MFFARLVLALAITAASVPPFPFAHYSDIHGVTPIGPACTTVTDGVTELSTADYRILSSVEKDVFIHLAEGAPDYVYFAKGTSGADVINVVRSLTIDAARVAYPTGPCPYFVEKEV